MGKSLSKFYKNSFNVFFHALFNLLIFFPYYFSTINLLKTLFSPWKNLVSKKRVEGFDLGAWFNDLCFNLISRFIGFCVRLSIITFYFLLQTIFIILLPIIILLYFLIIPFLYLISLLKKDENVKKDLLKAEFVKSHLLREENRQKVESWFESYYLQYIHKNKWWSVTNLFSTPPIARDWAMGYTPTLNQFSDELTSTNHQYKIKNIINREKEIKEIETALLKSQGANVLIVGEEGVGKHTIVDALAKNIFKGKINPLLAYKRILKLNLEKILSSSTDQKKREDFLGTLFEEAVEAKNIILLIEHFDKYAADISLPLEKYLSHTELQIIGITTPFAYQKFIYPNDKFKTLFNKVDVYEINEAEAEKILLNTAPLFETRYGLIIPYETIKNTLEKSDFFITDIPFPEKSIELLDNTCAYAKQHNITVLLPETIDTVLSEKTHISTILSQELKQKLINLEKLLSTLIIGQDEAIDNLSSSLRRSYLLLGKRKKPLSSFLFLGPTGVGKTETGKAIAQVFFGSEKNLLRFDMSLYQSKQDIPRLIGSIDTNEIGLLTENIRKTPYGVLLLDEIEKADHDLLNIFLTVLDEGYFTDGFGKKVDCKNLIIIATSNAGADYEKIFPPEFLNRFDGINIFHSLNQEAVIKVAKKMLTKIVDNIYKLHKVRLSVSENTLTDLAQKGYDEKFGARNMERLIRSEIEDKAAKLILANQVKEGETISL